MSRACLWRFIVGTLLWCGAGWGRIDSGQGTFFPKGLGDRLELFSSFSVNWWSILTFEVRDESDFAYVREACHRLRSGARDDIDTIECGDDISAYLPVLRDWASDIVIRERRPSDAQAIAGLKSALAKASLPMGRELLEALRLDPLETHRELRRLAEQRTPLRLPRHEGLYYDEQAARIAIPLKLAFPPAQAERTGQLWRRLIADCEEQTGDDAKRGRCGRWGMVGPHASTAENRGRVMDDLGIASVWGTILLVLCLVAIAFASGWRLLLLLPIVGVAVGAGFVATHLWRGAIHGLTLSFGTGIVGLAMDYGMHRAVNDSPYVWRSNAFGLLTTVAVLAVLMASEIPLLREIMIFSAAGITIGFLTLYVLFRRYPRLVVLRALPLSPAPSARGLAATIVIVSGAVMGLFTLSPAFDLAALNYQSPQNRELTEWLFRRAGAMIPFFRIEPASDGAVALASAHEAKAWASAAGVRYEGPARWLPPREEQRSNLASWSSGCDTGEDATTRWKAALGEPGTVLFEPFLSRLECGPLRDRLHGALPRYASDFEARGRWLSLFFLASEQVDGLKARYPDAVSLRELVSVFPLTLRSELAWMAPLAFLLVGLLLYHYFRRPALVALAYLPFLTGIGLCGWLFSLFGLSLTFVSLLALVMLFGLSVDYGIFATDSVRFPEEEKTGAGWTGVLYASATTVAGFIPLLFCQHPVLQQFGGTLTFGIAGTLLGAFLGVPAAYAQFRKRGWT